MAYFEKAHFPLRNSGILTFKLCFLLLPYPTKCPCSKYPDGPYRLIPLLKPEKMDQKNAKDPQVTLTE
jgi:hypothetical protein